MSTEEELEAALQEINERARVEKGLNSRGFTRQLKRYHGVETARRLLRGAAPPIFEQTMEAGRPDLTPESVVLQPRFRYLFTQKELGEARRRLGIAHIAKEINLGAIGRPIGELQKTRSRRHRLTMVPSLFDGRTIRENYGFHVGGQAELQFNIGFEDVDGEEMFRHGVAFSLQPTRNMPDIRVLIPRIEKFNEFLRTYPDEYADLSMWDHTSDGRSPNYAPVPITERLIKRDSFVFLGVLQPAREIDIDWILDEFDRLMPLYDYVEGDEMFPALKITQRKGFEWSPGNKKRAAHTKYSRREQNVDKSLRHNVLQDALFKHLEKLHGEDETSGEQPNGNGKPVDVVVRTAKGFIYYEIKTGLTARTCLREALGQLMEYSYWPGARQANKLVIVGEPPLDADATKYMNTLRKKFALPVHYQQFNMRMGNLVA